MPRLPEVDKKTEGCEYFPSSRTCTWQESQFLPELHSKWSLDCDDLNMDPA
jgi:hypothetical protein